MRNNSYEVSLKNVGAVFGDYDFCCYPVVSLNNFYDSDMVSLGIVSSTTNIDLVIDDINNNFFVITTKINDHTNYLIDVKDYLDTTSCEVYDRIGKNYSKLTELSIINYKRDLEVKKQYSKPQHIHLDAMLNIINAKKNKSIFMDWVTSNEKKNGFNAISRNKERTQVEDNVYIKIFDYIWNEYDDLLSKTEFIISNINFEMYANGMSKGFDSMTLTDFITDYVTEINENKFLTIFLDFSLLEMIFTALNVYCDEQNKYIDPYKVFKEYMEIYFMIWSRYDNIYYSLSNTGTPVDFRYSSIDNYNKTMNGSFFSGFTGNLENSFMSIADYIVFNLSHETQNYFHGIKFRYNSESSNTSHARLDALLNEYSMGLMEDITRSLGSRYVYSYIEENSIHPEVLSNEIKQYEEYFPSHKSSSVGFINNRIKTLFSVFIILQCDDEVYQSSPEIMVYDLYFKKMIDKNNYHNFLTEDQLQFLDKNFGKDVTDKFFSSMEEQIVLAFIDYFSHYVKQVSEVEKNFIDSKQKLNKKSWLLKEHIIFKIYKEYDKKYDVKGFQNLNKVANYKKLKNPTTK